jgi:hypothetical protein
MSDHRHYEQKFHKLKNGSNFRINMNILSELFESLLNFNGPDQPEYPDHFGQLQQLQTRASLIPLNVGQNDGLEGEIGNQVESEPTFQIGLRDQSPVLDQNPLVVNPDVKLHQHNHPKIHVYELAE